MALPAQKAGQSATQAALLSRAQALRRPQTLTVADAGKLIVDDTATLTVAAGAIRSKILWKKFVDKIRHVSYYRYNYYY
jgi:hypothetical protein